MKYLSYRGAHYIGLSILICAIGLVRTMGGLIAVDEWGSSLPSDDGCLLAFVYNQEGDERLVVVDEKNSRHYEAPLKKAGLEPFWEGGKVYVINHYGSLQGFTIGSDGLVAEKEETMPSLSTGVVRSIAYNRGQSRLYLIRSRSDDHRKVFYELSAIDFPTRKTLWTKRIDNPGLITIFEPNVCVTDGEVVQVFNCDTGAKSGEIDTTKVAPSVEGSAKQ